MGTLAESILELAAIRAGASAYGPGDSQEQATRFYYDQVLPLVIPPFVERSAPLRKQLGPVDLQISMLGYSPETAILAHHALLSKRVTLLHTAGAAGSIEVVRRFIIEDKSGPAPNSQLSVCNVLPSDPCGIVGIIRDAMAQVRRHNPSARIVIDITGGKKIMSAAAASAATRFGLPIVYIDGEYDPKLRRPTPGTEQLIWIPHDSNETGPSWNHAVALFNAGHYDLAIEEFSIIESASGAAEARTWQAVSEFYAAWSTLDIGRLHQAAESIVRLTTQKPQSPVTEKLYEPMAELLRIARALGSPQGEALYLPFLLTSVANFRRRLKHFDLAALLYYRAIEACFQSRLGCIAPGFRQSAPDYRLIQQSEEELLRRMSSTALEIAGFRQPTSLPTTIGLMSAVLLLLAIEDALPASAGLTHSSQLQSFHSAATLRNESILGHGTRTIDASACDQLATWAERILDAYVQSMDASVSDFAWDPKQIVEPPYIDLTSIFSWLDA